MWNVFGVSRVQNLNLHFLMSKMPAKYKGGSVLSALLQAELQTVKSELTVSITNIQLDVSTLKNTVGEMETSLSTCCDDIATLQAKVEHVSAKLEVESGK